MQDDIAARGRAFLVVEDGRFGGYRQVFPVSRWSRLCADQGTFDRLGPDTRGRGAGVR